MEKKQSKKLFFRLLSHTTKSPIFATISFIIIFFIIYAENIVSDLSAYPLDLQNYEIFESQIALQDAEEILPATFATTPRLLASNNVDEEVDAENSDPLIPPKNLTKEERIVWFGRKLSETEILDSNDLTQKFHGRVLEFLSNNCTMQFFMTWFEPAKGFGKREFFTLDTLFKSHPQGCLMIISRTMDSKRGYRILKPLLDSGFKILTVTPDVPFLLKNTPGEAWLEEMKNGDKDPGLVPFPHNLSNLVRIALLYKYGGAFLDTDFIILKDFSESRNAIGVQSIHSKTKQWTRLNNEVLIFDINHPLLLDFMEEFALNFNGNQWGSNGPYLVSRVVERAATKPGYNFTILPMKAFYPVNWRDIHKYLKRPENESESRWVESKVNELSDGETYGLHLWNKQSKELEIEEGSVVAKLVSDHCVICQGI